MPLKKNNHFIAMLAKIELVNVFWKSIIENNWYLPCLAA